MGKCDPEIPMLLIRAATASTASFLWGSTSSDVLTSASAEEELKSFPLSADEVREACDNIVP